MASLGLPTIQAIVGTPAALLVAKATAVAIVGLFASWLARRDRAAVRHSLLTATFGVLLALPVASCMLPALSITIFTEAPEQTLTLPASAPTIEPTQPASGPEVIGRGPAVPDAERISVSDVALGVWVAGAIVFLAPFLAGAWKLRSLARSVKPWVRGQLVVNDLARESGIKRSVELTAHEALPGPMTCGAFRPKIVLPLAAETWEPEELKRALVHELEHVGRGDWLIQCVSRAVCSVYWFNPLVWAAWRRLSLEAERSCDDAVLRDSESTAYADQLVALAHTMMITRSPVPAMASRSDLATRVRSVLDCKAKRGKAGTRFLAFACAAALTVLMAVSPLRLVSAVSTTPSTVLNRNVGTSDGQRVAASSTEYLELAFAEKKGTAPVAGTGAASASRTPTRAPLPYDVCSVKRSPEDSASSWRGAAGGGFNATSIPVIALITSAFGIQDFQISGLPGWATADRYDVACKDTEVSGENQPPDVRMRSGIQALLADRFGFLYRRESKRLPTATLTLGKRGLKATPSKSGGPWGGSYGPTFVKAQAWTMGDLARVITILTSESVSDKTGLSGRYDFELDWALVEEQVPGSDPGAPPKRKPLPDLPFLSPVLDDRLGLTVKRTMADARIIIVDRIERPTPN